ncbi:unnamed protein product [Durusdinium trenchii]|uniref:Peptidase M12A domain-containing protein n=1 Tax=Durusdinium trenchii TaxID=1381693 RepID=A0ABP0HZQ8_9DINO
MLRFLPFGILLLAFPCLAQGNEGDCSDQACSKTGGSLFIQRRLAPSKVSADPVAAALALERRSSAAWVAAPFGDCRRACPSGQRSDPKLAFQERPVQCFSTSGELLEDSSCHHLMKPEVYRQCHCGVIWCAKECQDFDLEAVLESEHTDIGDERDSEFECLGCFPLGEDDGVADLTADARDVTCMDWQHDTPCRGGLPFYRLRMNKPMSAESCFEFCIGAGMDLFGLVEGVECRCGASRLNKGIWRDEKPRPGLELPAPLSGCMTEQKCPLRVYRWLGPFVGGGTVPEHLMMSHIDDQTMVDSIVTGRPITEEDEEDGEELSEDPAPMAQAQTENGQLEEDVQLSTVTEGPGWGRLCDDNDGCLGARPWIERTAVPPEGMSDQWQEYVIFRYKFKDGTDAARKEGLRAAAAEWRLHTCVAVIEDQDIIQSPFIVAGLHTAGSCSATLGRPLNSGKLNMGWCNSLKSKGSLVHEIGHNLGMYHHQNRPDGSARFNGKGPHLEVYWQNLIDSYKSFLAPKQQAYTGSQKDGENDPQVGYAAYNFESIMHYGRGVLRIKDHSVNDGYAFNTIPKSYNSVVGQRHGLSDGDKKAIFDAYRCRPMKDFQGTWDAFEVNQIQVPGTAWTTFHFTVTFDAVPVVVVLPTHSGRPATVRLRQITTSSFQALVVVPPGTAGNHGALDVTFMAAVAGRHRLKDGRTFEARRVTLKNIQRGNSCTGQNPEASWTSVSLLRTYEQEPAFAASVQSCNNELGDLPSSFSKPFMSVAVSNLTASSVQLALELAQTAGEGEVLQEETIGFIAMEQGSGNFRNLGRRLYYTAKVSAFSVKGRSDGDGRFPVPFPHVGTETPLVIGGHVSRMGSDGGWLRLFSCKGNVANVYMDEDQFCDSETWHWPAEQVGSARIRTKSWTWVPFEALFDVAPVVVTAPIGGECSACDGFHAVMARPAKTKVGTDAMTISFLAAWSMKMAKMGWLKGMSCRSM